MKKIIKTIMMAVACGGFFPAAATAQSYQLVTSTSDLESGKRYLIVAKSNNSYYAWSGFNGNTGNAANMSDCLSGSTFISAGDAVPMQLVQSEDGTWKIIDLSTGKYVGVESTNNNYRLAESSVFSNSFLWYISFESSTLMVQSSKALGKYLKFIYNTGASLFSIYDQSGGADISLYKETGSPLILHNDKDNTTAISEAANANKTYDVILENRMLSKDGKWNTLCLPFDYDYSKTGPLADATIMELDVDGYYDSSNTRYTQAADGLHRTGFDATSSTLYLFFKTASSIEAGKPYIIKWDNASGTIDSPTFSNVTISNTTSDVTSQDGYVTFKGGYNVKSITGVDQSILFLGSGNNVYYPSAAMNINAFRAYFQLNGITAGEPANPEQGGSQMPVRSFALNFGDSETSSIENVQCSMFNVQSEVWYTLDGRRLDGKPTARGIYVNSGRKVVIK